MTFADWLSEKMEMHHMSQSDLAHRLGLTRGAVNNLLAGRSKNPSSDTIQKLSDIFHVPPETIYRHANLLPNVPEVDEWVDEMNHWLVQIPTDLRGIAENNIKYLAMEGERRDKKNR